MNYKTVFLVVASVIALVVITFIMYKQSVDNVAQPQNVDEVVFQQQINEIFKKGTWSDCVLFANEPDRLACFQYFTEAQKLQNSGLQLVPQYTTLLSNKDIADLINRSSSIPSLVVKKE